MEVFRLCRMRAARRVGCDFIFLTRFYGNLLPFLTNFTAVCLYNDYQKGDEMYFELYVDSLFFLNFTVSFCILYLTDHRLGGSATLPKMLTGALAGSILSILPLFFRISLKSAMIAGLLAESFVMVLIPFGFHGTKGFLHVIGILAEHELVVGAILIIMIRLVPGIAHIMGHSGVISAMTVIVTFFLCLIRKRQKEPAICEAVLYYEGNQVRIPALLDSGNSLAEPVSGKPVSVVKERIMKDLFKDRKPEYYRVIPYRSVGKEHGVLKGYFIPKMEVLKAGVKTTFENVWIGVWEETEEFACGEEKGADLLLNPGLFKR